MIKHNHKPNLSFLIIIFILQILLALVIAQIYLLSQNSLKNNGQWLSTKRDLEMGVLGGESYFSQRQALAQYRLNLGAWHGYQELIYKNKINPQEIKVDFFLTDNSYFYFVFNKDADKFSGIRISINNDFNSIYVTADDSGEFIKKEKLALNNLKKNKWNHLRVNFRENSFSLFINQKLIGNFEENLLAKQSFGFRGSSKAVLIDNILVQQKGSGTIIKEDFYNKGQWVRSLVIILLIVIVFNIGGFFLGILGRNPLSKIYLNITAVNVFLLLILTSYLIFDFFLQSKRYPNPDSFFRQLRKKEQAWREKAIDSLNREIMEKYMDKYYD